MADKKVNIAGVDLHVNEENRARMCIALEALAALIDSGALKVSQQGNITADIIDADIESLMDAALPSGSDDPQAAVTAGAAWADIEIPANAQIAVVRLKSYDCYLVAQAARSAANGGSDPAEDGVEFMVNKEHYLSVRGKAGGGLCYKKVAAGAADVTLTFLLSQ